MNLFGVLPEPPFDPISWSGTSAFFFGALRDAGVLLGAANIGISKQADLFYRTKNFRLPVSAWREAYHLDVDRFERQSRYGAGIVRKLPTIPDAVLQIGAWYSIPKYSDIPCFSYHDGNLALRVRSGLIGLEPHHPLVQRALEWERMTYEKMTGIFVMSSWLADSFVKDYGLPREKVHVVGAGMNLDSLPQATTAPRSTPRFLIVGRDFERKGGQLLLEAFKLVRSKFPQAELMIVGPELRQNIPGVISTGYLSKRNSADKEKLDKAYNEASVYVLPSLYEPFGISLLEAMSYSLPCIAANHCAMPEIVKDGVTGLVVNPGDVTSLAAAMVSMASDPTQRRKFGDAGRQRLVANYTWKAVSEKIIGVISSHI